MSSYQHVIGWFAIVFVFVVVTAILTSLYRNPTGLDDPNAVREEAVRQCVIQRRHLEPGGGDVRYTPDTLPALTQEEADSACSK